MIKFVVFGLQRTGTTWVVSLLQSHPGILSLGEIFSQKENKLKAGISSYKLYLKQLSPGDANGPPHRENMIKPYLDTIFSKKGYDAIGFKLMLNQIPGYQTVMEEYLKKNQFKVILVQRENLLHTFISRLRSQKTGIFNNLQAEYREINPRDQKIHVPVKVLLNGLKMAAEQASLLKENVSNLGLDYITVTYEKLSENTGEETQKVLDFLEIETKIQLSTPLEKVSPPLLKNSIKNYKEIARALKGTPYATYLE